MTVVETLSVKIAADTSAFKNEMDNVSTIANDFAGSLGSAFEDVIFRGKDFGDVMRQLASQLSSNVFRSAMQPVLGQLSGGLGGGVSSFLGGLLPFAQGGVIEGGRVKAFAQGGVIDRPHSFPLAGDMTGLAGEAGPEAILPLGRGSDGQLGVKAQTGGAPVSVTFNISTPDVEGFRRSESQIAAMMSRTMSRGERNL